MNINMLMQKAQSMQKDMQKAQDEVSKMTFTSKQQLVEVEVTGDKKITKIKIDENISMEDIDMLEDMIMIAINDALDKASNEMEQRLSKFGQGIPGLF